MTKKYRLYHGWDCNSMTGFDNGSYLEDAGIFHDEDEARQFVEEFFILKGQWDNCDPDAYHVITGYYDKHGNRIEEEEFDVELDHSYSYEYISVEETRQ